MGILWHPCFLTQLHTHTSLPGFLLSRSLHPIIHPFPCQLGCCCVLQADGLGRSSIGCAGLPWVQCLHKSRCPPLSTIGLQCYHKSTFFLISLWHTNRNSEEEVLDTTAVHGVSCPFPVGPFPQHTPRLSHHQVHFLWLVLDWGCPCQRLTRTGEKVGVA